MIETEVPTVKSLTESIKKTAMAALTKLAENTEQIELQVQTFVKRQLDDIVLAGLGLERDSNYGNKIKIRDRDNSPITSYIKQKAVELVKEHLDELADDVAKELLWKKIGGEEFIKEAKEIYRRAFSNRVKDILEKHAKTSAEADAMRILQAAV